MKVVNRKTLHIKLIEIGWKFKDLAQNLGISYPALWKKMKGATDFSENEIFYLVEKFGYEIFFTNSASKRRARKEAKQNE